MMFNGGSIEQARTSSGSTPCWLCCTGIVSGKINSECHSGVRDLPLDELGELLLLGSEVGDGVDESMVAEQRAELPVLFATKTT